MDAVEVVDAEAEAPVIPHPSSIVPSATGDRLQKLLARAGIASRRASEEMIAQGRVSVNGHVVREPGLKANPLVDRIIVDGKPLTLPTGPATVVLLHKPKGYVSTRRDPEGRPTVMELLPDKFQALHPVGRLDFDTSGVLLLTDDGDLTQLLTHPSHGVEKIYWARVRGPVPVEVLRELETGIFLEDGKTAPCRCRVRAKTEQNALLEVALREGRNRQVRRMLQAVGHPAKALRRVRFGGFALDGLRTGEYRLLIPAEVHALRKGAEAKPKRRAPAKTRAQAGEQKPARQGQNDTSEKPAASRSPRVAVPKTAASGRHPSPKPARQHPVAKRVEREWEE